MTMRLRIVAVLALIFLAVSLGTTTRAQQDANPTVVAIQTEIANLEAQLTAIAGTPALSGSPAAEATVDYGSFTLTFSDAWVERTKSLGGSADPAEGIYALVHYTATNNGN